jgi:hypothetical protein
MININKATLVPWAESNKVYLFGEKAWKGNKKLNPKNYYTI